MAGVAFAVEGDGVGFATESYAASALYTTLASLLGALWRIRRARYPDWDGLRRAAVRRAAGFAEMAISLRKLDAWKSSTISFVRDA